MSNDRNTSDDVAINFAASCACFNIRKTAHAITNLYDTVLRPTKRREIIPLWEQAQARIIATGLGHQRWGRLYDNLQQVVRLAQA